MKYLKVWHKTEYLKKKKKQFVGETLFSGHFSADSWMFSVLHHISRHELQSAG